MSKVSTFAYQDALSTQSAFSGVFVGGGIMLGTFCSKPVVQKLSIRHFSFLIDVMLLISGAGLLSSAWLSK